MANLWKTARALNIETAGMGCSLIKAAYGRITTTINCAKKATRATVDSIRWRVFDRQGNQIYLTEERWQHIIAVDGHPEMEDYEEDLKETIRQGQRRQIPLHPQKYEYSKAYSHLVDDNTHIIALVLFRMRERDGGRPVANNYIVTAYQKEIE